MAHLAGWLEQRGFRILWVMAGGAGIGGLVGAMVGAGGGAAAGASLVTPAEWADDAE